MELSLSAQIAIGSALIHAEEFMSEQGHFTDKAAFESCMRNPEVKTWLEEMNKNAFLPVKR